MASIVDDLLLTALHGAGLEVLGHEDLNALLGLEKLKDAVGCDDVACGVEIGHALGVDHLITGSAAVFQGGTALTLKLIDVRNTRVISRAQRLADDGEGSLPSLIDEAVDDLLARASR